MLTYNFLGGIQLMEQLSIRSLLTNVSWLSGMFKRGETFAISRPLRAPSLGSASLRGLIAVGFNILPLNGGNVKPNIATRGGNIIGIFLGHTTLAKIEPRKAIRLSKAVNVRF